MKNIFGLNKGSRKGYIKDLEKRQLLDPNRKKRFFNGRKQSDKKQMKPKSSLVSRNRYGPYIDAFNQGMGTKNAVDLAMEAQGLRGMVRNRNQQIPYLVRPQEQVTMMNDKSKHRWKGYFRPDPKEEDFKKLFFDTYKDKQQAIRDHKQAFEMLRVYDSGEIQQQMEDFKKLAQSDPDCRIFPPLPVRFDTNSSDHDLIRGISIKNDGEVQSTGTTETADFYLFFLKSGAIIMRQCGNFPNPSPLHLKNMNIAVTALYNMKSENPLNLSEFATAFDRSRIELLKTVGYIYG